MWHNKLKFVAVVATCCMHAELYDKTHMLMPGIVRPVFSGISGHKK